MKRSDPCSKPARAIPVRIQGPSRYGKLLSGAAFATLSFPAQIGNSLRLMLARDESTLSFFVQRFIVSACVLELRSSTGRCFQRSDAALMISSLILIFGSANISLAEGSDDRDLERQYREMAAPFLETYCVTCHGNEDPAAKLDLTRYSSADEIAAAHQVWEIVLDRLLAQEMPPEDSELQPTELQREEMTAWIRAIRRREASRHAGDPGMVLARRLNNEEYNYTIRDLTGVDMRPTETFPIDPANESGFDNSGESLMMSPALLTKYLGAANQVVDHLVLTPSGISFAPHPVITDTDRDRYCVKRIVEFYLNQPIDYADYFMACWEYRQRRASPSAGMSPAEFASVNHLSPKYLRLMWKTLTETRSVGPIARLQEMWRQLPEHDQQVAREQCEVMRDFVVNLRKKLEPEVTDLSGAGVHKGAQAFVLWKNREYAKQRMRLDPARLQVEGESFDQDPDADLYVPSDKVVRARYEAEFAEFCRVFPDAFFISERGRDYLNQPKDRQEKGRLLSAGFHSMMGYFRDDAPLYVLVLSSEQQQQLDRLWQELDFVASAPMRQYSSFLWFERTDSSFMRDAVFDFARPEDKSAHSETMIARLAAVYLNKVRQSGGSQLVIEAVTDYFRISNEQIRSVEQARKLAEPIHLSAIQDFAERAYRRPLSDSEQEDLQEFYTKLRLDGLGHDDAIRDSIIAILLSPHFGFRMDLGSSLQGERPLTQYELASRLSYFLWSSMPDSTLIDLAARGTLSRPEVLTEQTDRMLRDSKIRGLATEFGGHWLDFRQFEDHNSVDRDRFPGFDDALRLAMYEEPIRFLVDTFQNDRSVLGLLNANYTFANRVLARHYGFKTVPESEADWVRIDEASRFHRGGLLPMSVFLTKNSPGLRTSPVKRGYWVVRQLLGEHIPPPPPGVPELPADESTLGELSLREMLAHHRAHESCAGCHDRFDSIGIAFEGFGPIGEFREHDLGGRPVDTRALFPDGGEGVGLEGLRKYLRDHRRADFVNNLCAKLLSYSLGRSLVPSDDSLLLVMQQQLETNDDRFSCLIESIVTSRQFLNKRGANSIQGVNP